jgi:nucleoside-diphosphate-sugar epimerase
MDDLEKYRRWYTSWLSLIKQEYSLSFTNKKAIELGCGIGSFTSLLHDEGCDVTGSDISEVMVTQASRVKPEIPFVVYDVMKPFPVKNNFDFVFHLAGILRPQNLREGFLGNILPLENLLEAAKAHKNLKAIFLASSSRVSSIEKSKIDFEALSQKPYDFSKTLGELMAKSYLREDNLPIVIVKYANVFGPGDNLVKPLRLTSAIIDDLKHHRKFIPSGNSQNPVEFLYVKDLVTEFIKSAEHYKKLIGQEVLVKPSAKYTVGEWAEKIAKVIKNKKNTSKLEKSIQTTYKWE